MNAQVIQKRIDYLINNFDSDNVVGMNASEVIEARKEQMIKTIDWAINTFIVQDGRNEIPLDVPKDYHGYLRDYYENKGFKVRIEVNRHYHRELGINIANALAGKFHYKFHIGI